jgi:adenosine/AMP kinase
MEDLAGSSESVRMEFPADANIIVGGNDQALQETAIRNAQALACGHTFVLVLLVAYPINLLNAIRNVPEVCSINCATANPVEMIVARTEQGQGVLGVIDGESPKGVEGQDDTLHGGTICCERSVTSASERIAGVFSGSTNCWPLNRTC